MKQKKRYDWKDRAANASVSLTEMGGRGVLVPTELILSACHCVNFETTMALEGEHFIVKVRTEDGTKLKVAPLFLDPMADLAVLGALDGQEFPEEVEAFRDWCERTKPVPLCTDEFQVDEKCPAFIYTHKRSWVKACLFLRHEKAHKLDCQAFEQIKGGTSGGAIVSRHGHLIGVVSNTTVDANRTMSDAACSGSVPYLLQSLPHWARERILEAQACK